VHHESGTAWGISFPDLPGCMSAADRFEDLPAAAAEAVALWLEVDGEHGRAAPPPRRIEDILTHADAKGAVSFLPVKAPTVDRVVRLNITLPGPLVQRIDAVAGERGRSAFLARAARRALA